MTTTTTPSTLQEIRYRREFLREYVRDSGFMADMKASNDAPIHMLLDAVPSGQSIKYPLVDALRGSGVYDQVKLNTREEAANKLTDSVTVRYRRNAVELAEDAEHYSFSKLEAHIRPMLKEWSANLLRFNLIDAFMGTGTQNKVWYGITPRTPISYDTDGTTVLTTPVAADTSANTDAWVTQNYRRVVFGEKLSNNPVLTSLSISTPAKSVPLTAPPATVSSSYANGLATVTSSTGRASASQLKLMRRVARMQSTIGQPAIRPLRIAEQGREYYKVYVGPLAFKDLKRDPEIYQANAGARAREGNGMDKNPIFQDGYLEYDGMIIVEIPEMPLIAGAGASSIDVEPMFLVGCQAIGVGWGQLPLFKEKKETDYDFFTGIGLQECLGVKKLQRVYTGTPGTFNVDNGIVTGFVAGIDD